MSIAATPEELEQNSSAKQSAALSSVLAAFAITLLKLLTGLLTGSLGMLSEAAHSGIDLIAAAITLFSVRVSDRPADESHNYGHGKIESLSAFAETVIMLVSSLWILKEALHRIFFREHLALTLPPRLAIWPVLVLLLSIAVDYTRSRNLHRVAREHSSEALEADAIHFSTDIWSSFAVLLGLAATFTGQYLHIASLELADPIAAILVSLIILRISYTLARRTIDTLTDATPAHSQTRRDIMHDLQAIPGVLSVDRLRTRKSGPSYFADVTLGLPRNLTFQRSEQITMAATLAVRQHLPEADVVVHSIPTASLAESVHDRIRAVAARANLSIHDVTVHQFDNASHGGLHPGGLHIDQHLEVDETMPLIAAHALVTQLESDMRREVPQIASILTHIESEPATIERPASLERDRQLEARLRRVALTFPEILDIHDVLVTRTSTNIPQPIPANLRDHHALNDHHDRIQVSCHCTLPDDLPMARVHAIITALESSFKLESPEVSSLLIHPEPATDNRR